MSWVVSSALWVASRCINLEGWGWSHAEQLQFHIAKVQNKPRLQILLYLQNVHVDINEHLCVNVWHFALFLLFIFFIYCKIKHRKSNVVGCRGRKMSQVNSGNRIHSFGRFSDKRPFCSQDEMMCFCSSAQTNISYQANSLFSELIGFS